MKTRSHFRPIALALTAAIVAVAAFTTTASGAGGPVNQTAPTLSGTAKAGETLTATNGTWTPAPTGTPSAWRRCSETGPACPNSDGATASPYVPPPADAGNPTRVVVTAADAIGTTDNPPPSAVTGVIAPGAAPQNTAPPTVSG